jgi:hypothetical protein
MSVASVCIRSAQNFKFVNPCQDFSQDFFAIPQFYLPLCFLVYSMIFSHLIDCFVAIIYRDQYLKPVFDFKLPSVLTPSPSYPSFSSAPRSPSPWAKAILRVAHSFVGALESFLGNGSSMDVFSAQPISTPLTFVAETNLPTSHGTS